MLLAPQQALADEAPPGTSAGLLTPLLLQAGGPTLAAAWRNFGFGAAASTALLGAAAYVLVRKGHRLGRQLVSQPSFLRHQPSAQHGPASSGPESPSPRGGGAMAGDASSLLLTGVGDGASSGGKKGGLGVDTSPGSASIMQLSARGLGLAGGEGGPGGGSGPGGVTPGVAAGGNGSTSVEMRELLDKKSS